MTLEELLECSAEQLEAMTDAELTAHFDPYFQITRPELAPKPKQRLEQETQETFQKKQKVMALAGLGIDVSYLLRKKKKK